MKLSNLVDCDNALSKLFLYSYLPAKQVFFLATMQGKINETINAYHNARNVLLAKHGTSEDEVNYSISGDRFSDYQAELNELENQEVSISFPADKITLCVESIEKAEQGLSIEKRLGFSASDWLAIQEIIKVIEMEE